MGTDGLRIRAGVLSVIALCAACTPLPIDTRSLFADETYPKPTPADASTSESASRSLQELDLQLFAALELEAVIAYRDPAKMGDCIRALDAGDIEELGNTLIHAGGGWADVVRQMKLKGPCNDTGDSLALVQFVIARIASTAAYMASSEAMTDELRHHNVYERVPSALKAIADIVANTTPRTEETEDAPALALSGGAANGAFSAGFMFELLSLRERALLAENDRSDRGRYRFSALVGTSVGALIAQILDLYFVDSSLPVQTTRQKNLIEKYETYWDAATRVHTCFADGVDGADTKTSDRKDCFDGWPTPAATGGLDADMGLSGLDRKVRDALFARRPRQMTALTALYQAFTDDDEQTLMCVESGPITRLVGVLGVPDQNLMRFDPMSSDVIAPVLDAFSDELIHNDVPRIVVSVESEDNQTVGLDERTCALMPSKPAQGDVAEAVGGREYCLGSAVMASAVLPVFARAVRHTYDGVIDGGFCGTWFDGGLRSGFPVYRALRMTRPALEGIVHDPSRALRVLAVGTGPLEGLPQGRPGNVLGVTLDAIGQMSNQNQVEEVVLAQQMARVREDELLSIMKKSRPSDDTEDTSIGSVLVPAETPSYLVAGADYSFDRTLMRGLWVWGRHVAIERVLGRSVLKGTRKLFDRLGWSDLQNAALPLAKEDERTMKPWLDAFRIPTECREHQEARAIAGVNRIKTCVPTCEPVTTSGTNFPQFLVCPPGVSRPARETRRR